MKKLILALVIMCLLAGCKKETESLPTDIATKITMLYVKRMEKNTFKVYFNVDEDINTLRYDVKLSTDGINFKTRAIIFPDNTKAGKYEVTIKL